MKNFLLALALCLAAYGTVNAQYLVDIQGKPYTEISYTEVEGDPYLVSDWVNGVVYLPGDKKFDIALKYDSYGGRLLYRSKTGEMMEFETKVTGFTINSFDTEISDVSPLMFSNGYPAAGKQTAASFYQLVGDGKVKLLKYYKKLIQDEKAFNSATTKRSFFADKYYYVFANNQMIPVNANKKSILKALPAHASEMETYLKTTGINFKSDADLAKLFAYYDSLK